MTVAVNVYEGSSALEAFQSVANSEQGMVYYSLAYHRFLGAVLDKAKFYLLIAHQGNTPVGFVTLYTVAWQGMTVLNANPYFGSHGGPMLAPHLSGQQSAEIETALGTALADFARTQSVDAINVVAHPWNKADIFAQAAGLQTWDKRIGQISAVPNWQSQEQTSDLILAGCKQKTRNLVRKGLKQGFDITQETSLEAWRLLFEHHQISMAAIGGKAKTWQEFQALQDTLQKTGRTQLYIARKEGEFAGALLMLVHGPWAEYFVPVSVVKYRSAQVLSALIFEAMLTASQAGLRWWNWGGTWESQSGVYRFKSGWGAEDFTYLYWGTASSRMVETDVAAMGGPPDYFYVKPLRGACAT